MKKNFKNILKDIKKTYPFYISLFSTSHIAEVNNRKFLFKERPFRSLYKEFRALEFLKKKKFLFFPQTYGIFTYDGHKVIIQEYIEGKNFEEDKNLFFKTIDRVKIILQQLHSIKKKGKKGCLYFINEEVELIGNILEKTRTSCSNLGGSHFLHHLSKINDALILLRKALKRDRQYLETNIFPSFINKEVEFIISKRNKIYLVDFEHATFGDPAYDIAYLKIVFSDANIFAFIDDYGKIISLHDNFLLRVTYYQLIILIKEFIFYISDLNCCNFYKRLPPKIFEIISNVTIEKELKEIDSVYAELKSLKNP